MPLILIEYTSHLAKWDARGVMKKVHEFIAKEFDKPIQICESQARCAEQFFSGDGSDADMAFVMLRVEMAGDMSLDLKQKLKAGVIKILQEDLQANAPTNLRIKTACHIELTKLEDYTFEIIETTSLQPSLAN